MFERAAATVVVPEGGFEPPRRFNSPADFKSAASAVPPLGQFSNDALILAQSAPQRQHGTGILRPLVVIQLFLESTGRSSRIRLKRGILMARRANAKTNGGANLGFEQTLWLAADKPRGHMDAAEYKHVVLGLIFLKYIPARQARESYSDGSPTS